MSDAAKLVRTQPIVIVVDDVNDNMMRPGSKTVHLWKTRDSGSEAPLGRIYVDDPDDWDINDKTFAWEGSPHPFFSLNEQLGTIFASGQAREGRYDLHFLVTDHAWRQKFVKANVSVTVRLLPPEALTNAIPLTLLSATPASLTKEWTPSNEGGQLGSLSKYIKVVLNDVASDVEVVSLYGSNGDSPPTEIYESPYLQSYYDLAKDPYIMHYFPLPSACVWISVLDKNGRYINPVKLRGLLQMKLRKLVDSNTTSLVTPRLSSHTPCPTSEAASSYLGHLDQCTETSCLNGGRCVPTEKGKRCICPGGTVGQNCRILTRSFVEGGWAWLPPLPHCESLTLSMKFLTTRPNGVLLSSAPLTSSFPTMASSGLSNGSPADTGFRLGQPSSFMLQLLNGKVVLLAQGNGGTKRLQTHGNATLADGRWHRIDLILNEKGASLMIDAPLSFESFRSSPWSMPWKGGKWGSSSPIQIGGLANRDAIDYNVKENEIVTASLEGCLSELRIAEELIDLGEVAFSHGSARGCNQVARCRVNCGMRGSCPPEDPNTCDCILGWTGETCDTRSIPSTLNKESFARVALSFAPNPLNTEIQLRFRTRRSEASLITLTAERQQNALSIYIKERHLCFSVINKASLSDTDEADENNSENSKDFDDVITSPPPKNQVSEEEGHFIRETSLCVRQEAVSDGEWHLARGIRLGHTLSIELDDGNLWRRNSSLGSLVSGKGLVYKRGKDKADPWALEANHRLTGRVTAIVGKTFLHETTSAEEDPTEDVVCIDDVRVSGHPLPLPPAVNGSRWGQVTTMAGFEAGCTSPDVCSGISCTQPFVCRDDWWKASCSCPPNYRSTSDGCRKLEQCLYEPCLNGGKCSYSSDAGYSCSCRSDFTGRNCEWLTVREEGHNLRSSFIILGASLSLIFLVLILFCIFFRIYRLRSKKSKSQKGSEEEGPDGGSKERWKTAYFTEKSGEMHIEMAAKMKNPLGLITELKKNKKSESIRKGHEKLCIAQINTDLGETEISNRQLGLKDRPVVGISAFPPDDLRAYAYEGDESSSGSLGSAISGLRQEFSQELDFKPLTIGLNEVVDLLKNLPEVERSKLRSQIKKSQSHSCSSLFSSRGLNEHFPEKPQPLLMEKDRGISTERTCSLPKCDFSHLRHSPSVLKEGESTPHDCAIPEAKYKGFESSFKDKSKEGENPKQIPIASISKNISFTAVDQGIPLPLIASTKHLISNL